MENIGIEDPTDTKLSADESKAEELMNKHSFYDAKNLCWHTRLLWEDNPIEFTNVNRAASAASRIIKKYSKEGNETNWDNLQEVYQSNLDLGITEVVPKNDLKKVESFHYLNMSLVFKDSATTPVRPVFNANLEYGFGDNKTSFNKRLLEGPNLLPQLPQLLLRFRCYQHVAMLDISKLYSRIRLSKEDSEFQRFFWSTQKMGPNEQKANLKAFRHTRLIFGSRSSPYQAQWILRKHAELFGNEALSKNAYLDDIFIGNSNVKTVKKDLGQLIHVLNQGDFPSHKIISNTPEVLTDIEDSLKGPTDMAKIYGQQWNLITDTLSFNFKNKIDIEHNNNYTKRIILSEMMSLFDLLGLVQPYHLKIKLLFQNLCKIKLSWDDQIPQNFVEEFKSWIHELPLLQKINVKRCFLPPEGGRVCFIASFCDASNVGLGINTYIVSEDKHGIRYSQLALCKAKVLPLKANYTTPRGELAAAQLNARASNYVSEALAQAFGEKPDVFLFSDSEITLHRINNKPTKYKVWVANRITAIQKITDIAKWKYVKSKENPSDISSRSAYLREFIDSKLFWHGPEWLVDPKIEFQSVASQLSKENLLAEEEEIKKTLQSNALFLEKNNVIKDLLVKFNNWQKITKIIAWCKRFFINLKERLKGKQTSQTRSTRNTRQSKRPKINVMKEFDYDSLQLTPEEIAKSEILLFRYAQHEIFAEEIMLLKEDKDIQRSSSIKTLIPYLDQEDDILRHNSRILNYNPIILPKDHLVTLYYIKNVHLKYGHAGPSLTLYKVRKKVWLTSGRQQIKKAIYKCSCRPNIPLQERMGKLPIFRTENVQIWTHVGTDVLGPFYVKSDDGESTIKTFAILWTDLISRGIFVDLLKSADTLSVLQSMRKLTSMYGRAKMYYSDNASYYTKASNELKHFFKSIDWNQLKKQAQKFDGQWLFSTPASPFRNSTSERLVLTIKQALSKIVKRALLNFTELQICLLEISSYINNRPIGFVSSDPDDDIQAISPSLLTIGREIEPFGNYDGSLPDFKEIYERRNELIKEFLTVWKANYLNSLSPTNKWLRRNPYKLKEDMIVFIKDENRMKDLWQKGRITKIIHSKSDGLPRTVELKTVKGKIVRPIQKLSLPESAIIEENDSDTPGQRYLSVHIKSLSIPEILDQKELQRFLSIRQEQNI